MTQTLTFPARNETVEFDHGVLSALCEAHGAGVEAVLTARLTAVGEAMDLAATQLRGGELRGLDRTCADLHGLASGIGMRTIATAAAAVRAAIAQGDEAALAACGARMIRLGHPAGVDSWTVRHNTVA